MIKIFLTNAVIAKGFDGAPALRFSENGDNKSVRFRIGVSVYDKNLVSPFGLPKLGEWIVGRLDRLSGALKGFIFG